MPFEIGRAFSGDIFGMIEGARNRAAANPARFRRRRTYDTSLQEALLRAKQADEDRELKRELTFAGLDADRERLAQQGAFRGRELDLRERGLGLDDAFRRDREAQRAAEFEFDKGLKTSEAERKARESDARIAQGEAQIELGRGNLDARNAELDAERARLEAAGVAREHRVQAERARSVRDAVKSLGSMVKEAMEPNRVTGELDPAKVKAMIGTILSSEQLWTVDKGLPREEIRAAVSRAVHSLMSAAGISGADESGGAVDPLLDVGLGSGDAAPRLGG